MPRYSTKLKPKQKPKKSLLPLWLALAGLGLVLFAGWAVWSSSAQTKANIEVKGAPALQVDKEKVDFGNVTLGQTVEVKFEVANAGDQPLWFKETPYVEVVEGC